MIIERAVCWRVAIGLPVGAVRLPDIVVICRSPLLAGRSLAEERAAFRGVFVRHLSSRSWRGRKN
jgi:hypothetical protein